MKRNYEKLIGISWNKTEYHGILKGIFEHLSLDKRQMNNLHHQEEGDNPPANPHSA